MANTNSPFGLKPVGHLNGSSWNGVTHKYYVPTTESTDIGVGTAVKLAGSSDATGKYLDIADAGNNDRCIGVVVGIVHDPDYPRRTYIAGTQGGYVLVADSPDLVMEIQYTTPALTASDMNLNMQLSAESISTTTGVSSQVASAAATTNSLPLTCLGLVDRPDNALGLYQKVLVCWNIHERNGGTGTGITRT